MATSMKASLKNILRLLSNYFAIIPSCPVIYIKPDFHMSGKSQTIRVFTVSRLSQILPTNENVDIPDLGWTRTNLENRERAFLFSRRVPDLRDGRQSFPTNENSNLFRRGSRR